MRTVRPKEHYIRAVALIGFADYVRDRGGDPEALLRGLGLPLQVSGYSRQIISCAGFAQLLEDAAEQLGDRNFALAFSRDSPPHYPHVGPVALLGRIVADFAEWFAFSLRYWNLHSNAFVVPMVDVAGEPDLLALRFVCAPGYERTTQLVEGVFGNICGLARQVSGRHELRPVRVRFRHARPADMTLHAAMFGCDLAFAEAADELWFHRDILAVKINGSLRALRPFVERAVKTQIAALPIYDQTMRETARAAIESFLGSGNCSAEFIANSLGMSAKKLQRLLAGEATSFAEILSEVRRERAFAMLEETDIAIADIAGLLEYAQPGAFSNAFLRWAQMPPSEYRRRHRPEGRATAAAGGAAPVFPTA